MNKNLKQRIAELQKEKEQLKARAHKLQSQFSRQEKKSTDRRKYIVGAIVLNAVDNNDSLRKFVAQLLAKLPERDKKLFADFIPETAGTPTPAR